MSELERRRYRVFFMLLEAIFYAIMLMGKHVSYSTTSKAFDAYKQELTEYMDFGG